MLFRSILCTLLIALAGAAAGQSPIAGTLQVSVKDPARRPIANAHGTLSGPGGIRHLQTADDGSISVTGLAPGRYTLSLASPGFASVVLQIPIPSATPVTREITLHIGTASTNVNVTASTPIGSLDIPLTDVPVPVQTITAQTIEDTNAIDLTDVLKRRMNGVYVNENQNNPFQPDVNYRGYTASPLVGSPAGLSVYLDGVRQNQPFGDVVQWDLLPRIAINTTQLIPGSNPVYGLNTLGGAIVVQTKNGISNSGLSISAYGGSYGRRAVDMEFGGSSNSGWNWFAAGTLFHDDGWRVQSPSSIKQSFARLGYIHNNTALSLSGGYSINNLIGNGTQDLRAINRTVGLNRGYDSVYSVPDATYQHQPFLTLNAIQSLSSNFTLNTNAYIRYTRSNTTNGDINNDSFDQSLYTLSAADKTALTDAGIPFPRPPSPRQTRPIPTFAASHKASSSMSPAKNALASTPIPSTASTPTASPESSHGTPHATSSPSAPRGTTAASPSCRPRSTATSTTTASPSHASMPSLTAAPKSTAPRRTTASTCTAPPTHPASSSPTHSASERGSSTPAPATTMSPSTTPIACRPSAIAAR